MESVVNAIEIVITIFLMAGLGMLLYKLNWLDDGNLPLISKLVVKVALPCTIASTMFTQYTPESLIQNAPGILASLLSLLGTILLGLLFGKLLRLPARRMGVFVVMFAFSNSVFIGLPVSKALFGDSVTPYTLLYYIANTTTFWAIGYPLMQKYGGKMNKLTTRQRIATHIPLPLFVFFLCVLLIFLRITPPKFCMDAFGYVGNLVTPLSLIYTGAIMMRMVRTRNVHWQKGYLLVCIGRFVVGPGLLLLACLPFQISDSMRNVLMIQASMPVMAQTSLTAASTGSDDEYAAGGLALTTALSLLFIPIYMLLIETVL